MKCSTASVEESRQNRRQDRARAGLRGSAHQLTDHGPGEPVRVCSTRRAVCALSGGMTVYV